MTDTALPPLIQQMLQPEFYPHPVQVPALPEKPIQLIQTHVSYVFLTGEYAYKVKKPVNFGFLDYSTLEKRKHFCDEELRLNQRTASELYLEVLPITQTNADLESSYQFGGSGEVVEYVVKMQQFPQATLLTAMFEQNELTEDLVQELARVVAKFHTSTQTNDYIRSFGEVSQIRQAFDENFEQTEQYIGGPQTQSQFDQTRAYCDRFFSDQQALFTKRMQNDWIRECHGDLHLRNICFWKNRLWLFDCIEFNEPFRFVDVMFDVAYIVMDLDVRQRPDLKTLFLNTYAEQIGDWEGLQVLPIYVSRQTYVRAKVASFLLNDPTVPDAEKQKAHDTAALYYRWAWQYTHSLQGSTDTALGGHIFLMSGLSGSGKSTVARQLARQIGAIHIRSDAVRKHLAGVPLDERGDADLYTPEMTQKTYDRLLQLGITLAAQGYSVILDAKYDRQDLRQAVIQAVEQTNTSPAQPLTLHIFHCTAPLDVLRDRLHQRQNDISDATADLLPNQHMEPFSDAETPYLKTLDTTQDLDAQLRKIVEG